MPGVFSISWDNLAVDPPGTHRIARLTFPQGVLPAVHVLKQHVERESRFDHDHPADPRAGDDDSRAVLRRGSDPAAGSARRREEG